MIIVGNKKICYKEHRDTFNNKKIILISSPLSFGECEIYGYKLFHNYHLKNRETEIPKRRFKVFEKGSPGLFSETYKSFNESFSVDRQSAHDILFAIGLLIFAIVAPRLFVVAFAGVTGGILALGFIYNFMKLIKMWGEARDFLLKRKEYSDKPMDIIHNGVPKKWLIKNNKKSREDENESWFSYD
jgi:hypothetical protein